MNLFLAMNISVGHLKKGDIVIDGGNSFYKNSMERAEKLNNIGVDFFDCGTSGGIWGEKNGFALMVGGPKEKWPVIEPIHQNTFRRRQLRLSRKIWRGTFHQNGPQRHRIRHDGSDR